MTLDKATITELIRQFTKALEDMRRVDKDEREKFRKEILQKLELLEGQLVELRKERATGGSIENQTNLALPQLRALWGGPGFQFSMRPLLLAHVQAVVSANSKEFVIFSCQLVAKDIHGGVDVSIRRTFLYAIMFAVQNGKGLCRAVLTHTHPRRHARPSCIQRVCLESHSRQPRLRARHGQRQRAPQACDVVSALGVGRCEAHEAAHERAPQARALHQLDVQGAH